VPLSGCVGFAPFLLRLYQTDPAGTGIVAMNSMTNTCPACGKIIEFSERDVGRQSTCPHCKNPLLLQPPPGDITTAASPETSANQQDAQGPELPPFPPEVWSEQEASSGRALRWALVLPAAFAGFGLALGVFVLAWSEDPGLHIQIASVCLCPVAFVWSGAMVAPAHRFVTAIILTILLSIIFTALFTAGSMRGSYGDWFGTGWAGASAILGIACALGISFSIQRSEETKRRLKEKHYEKERI
jgi:hypothetical protein